ncbi:MAG TPA: MFS transporter [Opitutaceae bacterium]|nr:MFS transporter [Opitutaceae bacterium]
MVDQGALKLKLSVFMFLQYFIWGSWYASMATYLANTLKFGGEQIGAAYGAFAIGSIISPFFVGMIADRYFASQRILGVLGIAGGLVLLFLGRLTTFSEFYPLLIVYCALFAPTLALGNSVSLTHLANAKVDFPRIKIFSAIGWIAGGVTLSSFNGEQSAIQFQIAAVASFAFGMFSLLLPHTPPKKVGQNVTMGEILGLDALALMKKPSFAIFIGCMFLICIPLYFYFVMIAIYLSELQWTSIAGKLTLAQVSDIVFLFLLPVFLQRLGYKKTIFIGILAWALRYFFLAQSVSGADLAVPLIFGAILLHGVCYDFLFIAGQLYVDSEANERIRGAVQGFIAFILWGVGALVGTYLAGKVLAANVLPVAQGTILHNWRGIWLTPAIGAAVVMVIFLIFFREPLKKAVTGSSK